MQCVVPTYEGRTDAARSLRGTDQAMIEEDPSFGYVTVAYLLRLKKNTVQSIFQLKGWQTRKRPAGPVWNFVCEA